MGLGNWFRNEWYEAKEAGKEIKVFIKTHNWKKSARNSVKRKYWIWWIVTILACVALGLIAYYRDTIVEKFEPHKDDIVEFPVSYIYPVLILIILSFPPLGGHEIVLLIVGLIWGVWIGFAIACAGTWIGEMLCFFLFKYLLSKKAQEVEQKSIFYACLARMQREGGIVIISVVRFSVIPGHVVTAIQSCSGMSWWMYSIAVIISLPKQLAVVWLGDLFGQTGNDAAQKQSRAISLSVFFVTALMSVLALYSVYMRARRYYPELQREADLRRTKDGEQIEDTEEHPHPHNLAEATMEGEYGPGHYGRSGGSGGDLPYGGVYQNSTTRIPMIRTNTSLNSKQSQGPFADPSASTYTIPLDGDERGGEANRWREVEERERREAELSRVYDTDTGSYSHLPLGSASEVEAQSGHGYYPTHQPQNQAGIGAGAGGAIPYQPQGRQDQFGVPGGYGALGSTR